MNKNTGKKHSKTWCDNMSKALRGKEAWNDDLTKETDDRVKKSAQTLSKTRKELFKKGKLKNWITGLTKNTDKRVMNISKALFGKKHSQEHRAKNKKASIGKSVGNKNPCFGKFGSNHPAWKGDKAKGILRERIYGSQKYKDWRRAVFTRDNWTCQECGKQGYIEAHHNKKSYSLIMKNINTYDEAIKCKKLWDIGNGKTLCRSCHEKTFVFFGNQYKNNLVINANEVNSGKILTSNVEDNPEPSPKGKVRRSELK